MGTVLTYTKLQVSFIQFESVAAPEKSRVLDTDPDYHASKQNGQKKIIDVVTKPGTPAELISYFRAQWAPWLSHLFTRRWQKMQQDLCKSGLRKDELMTTADFSEKLAFQVGGDYCVF